MDSERPRRPIRLSPRAEEIALARDRRVSRNGLVTFYTFGGRDRRTDLVIEASTPQPVLSSHQVFFDAAGQPIKVHTVRVRRNRKVPLG